MITREDLLECVAHSRANDWYENKAAQRAEIASQVDDYLARGGAIHYPESIVLRAVRPSYEGLNGTTRRWEIDTRHAANHGCGLASHSKRRPVSINLPGSLTSPRA